MKINDKVTLLESSKGSFVYLVCGKENILIDTGFAWQGRRIIKELESMKIKPESIKHIFLTHYDLDHIGNAVMLQKYTGAKIWSSETDKPYILGEIHRPGFKKYLPYIFRVKKPESICSFEKECDPAGMQVDVQVISTPGHTPGHICFLFEDVLFAGDLIKIEDGKVLPYPSAWNWNNEELMRSIRYVSQYAFNWICPAHGRPIKRDAISFFAHKRSTSDNSINVYL
ncbi:MAG TPA: MBL fold metallo-hydrolase [Clostridia bacterium]|nr:MBL fold metallo-hydrolase [Clostridia bacterium]